ncbi:unnamed protein product [Calicophoron daubneyi]|uniref:Uncharacterized protein n=1 Tax=Calicophoron daubneyi TaxID=300641 RepID=A0AAV2TGE5_CALDB
MARKSSLGSLFRRSKSLGSPTSGGSSPMVGNGKPEGVAESPQNQNRILKFPCARIFRKRSPKRERWPMELHYNGKLSSFYAAKAASMRMLLYTHENRGVERRLYQYLEKRKYDTRYTTEHDENILYKEHYALLKAHEMSKARQNRRCALLQVLEMVNGF